MIITHCNQCSTEINNPTATKKYCDLCREQRQKENGQRCADQFRLDHNYLTCTNCEARYYHDNKKVGTRKRNFKKHFCSELCQLEYNAKVKIKICPVCGNPFNRGYYEPQKYCSQECKETTFKRNQTLICKWCLEPFPYEAGRKYCSPQCFRLDNTATNMNWPYRMKNNIYSKIEAIVAKHLTESGITFEHNFYIQPFFADFLLPNNIIIECDAIVCNNFFHNHCDHTIERDHKKDKTFSDLGYTVIRLKEDDILNNSYKNYIPPIPWKKGLPPF